jgi:hypothetical protein
VAQHYIGLCEDCASFSILAVCWLVLLCFFFSWETRCTHVTPVCLTHAKKERACQRSNQIYEKEKTGCRIELRVVCFCFFLKISIRSASRKHRSSRLKFQIREHRRRQKLTKHCRHVLHAANHLSHVNVWYTKLRRTFDMGCRLLWRPPKPFHVLPFCNTGSAAKLAMGFFVLCCWPKTHNLVYHLNMFVFDSLFFFFLKANI